LTLKAEVSAGTYIRSIAMDLGDILGTGWYITKLRRTKIGNIDLIDSNNLENFDENKILDIKKLFSHIKFIELNDWIMWKINNWLLVKIEDLKLKKQFIIWEDMFVWNWNDITNIVEFDWEYLKAVRKI
jgi:tRNA pseudouridine55 synthase